MFIGPNCQYMKSPFGHFKDITRKSKCSCHMCSLFRSSEMLEKFEELAQLYKMYKRSKPKRKRK